MDLVHEPGPLINNSLKDFFTENPCQSYLDTQMQKTWLNRKKKNIKVISLWLYQELTLDLFYKVNLDQWGGIVRIYFSWITNSTSWSLSFHDISCNPFVFHILYKIESITTNFPVTKTYLFFFFAFCFVNYFRRSLTNMISVIPHFALIFIYCLSSNFSRTNKISYAMIIFLYHLN